MALVVKAACAHEHLDRKALADRSGLSEDDVIKLLDATISPSLRVVSSVSRALHLSRGKLAAIAGLGSVQDAQNDAVMVRYATLSKGIGTLDGKGQELVEEFIKFMSED
jgi:DNA-binding phage protein